MQIKSIKNAEDLLSDISQYDEKYIFRGQEDAAWKLNPSAFRLPQYHPPKLAEKYNNLIHSEKGKKIIQDAICPLLFKDFIRHSTVIKLIELLSFILKYNYDLDEYQRSNPRAAYFNKEKKPSPFPRNHWQKSDTFLHMLSLYLPRIIIRTNIFDGSPIYENPIFEELTALDETFYQHYESSSAYLDWTRNKNIALYFAIENYLMSEQGILQISKKPPDSSKCFSLYCLKKTYDKNSPIVIEEFCASGNERQICQDGLFTFFSQPSSFYLQNGRFPQMEDYAQNKHNSLEIIKYNIPISIENIDCLKTHLDNLNINKETLLPDKYRTEII